MKLLFVHEQLGAFGGAEANIFLTASELRKRGHSVTLLHNSRSGRDEQKWNDLFTETVQLPESGRLDFLSRVMSESGPDLVYLHNFSDLDLVEALLESDLPVVRMVHDHSLYCMRGYKYNYFTRNVCKRAASAFCVFPCGASLTRNRDGLFPIKWNSYSAKKREISLNRRCDRVMVYSDYSRQELVRNGFEEGKIHVHVPMNCWGNDGPVSSFSDRNLILFAGQIIRGKGVDMLLKALSKVTVRFECQIVGDGSHRDYCEKLSVKLGLADRVKFAGYVLPDEIRNYYLDASVFAVSSLWPEPFGLVGPEAMRYGLPIVAFDSGGISEWLFDQENGFLVPWKDTDAFARSLETLLMNKDLAKKLGARGKEWVNQELESSRQVDRLENIFLELINKRGDRRETVGVASSTLLTPALAYL